MKRLENIELTIFNENECPICYKKLINYKFYNDRMI